MRFSIRSNFPDASSASTRLRISFSRFSEECKPVDAQSFLREEGSALLRASFSSTRMVVFCIDKDLFWLFSIFRHRKEDAAISRQRD